MKVICLFFISTFILSCEQKKQAQLEINFTSQEDLTLTHLESLTLTQFKPDQMQKNLTFNNIDCSSPNRFILKSVDTGIYLGLIEIKKDDGLFHIAIDSIRINSGYNILSKELNLGSLSIPQQ